ncbi:MAG: alpha/beta fold hydrolase [Allomuricauda sp.]|nr:MAG: alpha/beta fold hydrolase [Allomuricauda sp.]
MLQKLKIKDFITLNGSIQELQVTYEVFGQPLGTAPIVLVNHALTGNSTVTGKNGWWSNLIGPEKCIGTEQYTILAFNIPGNGYDGFEIKNYRDFVAGDIANVFLKALEQMEVSRLYAIIGGSLGGGIGWEMVALEPNITEYLIPIASDWKSTDWLIANCRIQEQFLLNSSKPIHDARMHAMLCYRTPESFKARFHRSVNEELGMFNIESWLLHHGKKLQGRFQLSAYKLMNQLLKTIDIRRDGEAVFQKIWESGVKVQMVGVDTDLFFLPGENIETLTPMNQNLKYAEIESIHGHDAFLIEFEQLEEILAGIFKKEFADERAKV